MNAPTRRLWIIALLAVACGSKPLRAAPTNADFINQAFQDLLARPPSGTELAAYQTFLATHTRQETALDVETATPAFHGIVVDDLYSLLLHRAPSPTEQSFSVNLITSGSTIEQAEAGIGGSSEYFIDRGGSTNGGFLTAMFSDLLGRTPTATELNTFSQQLTLGSTPGDITGEILAGIEYQTDLVDGYFPTYLRRSALSSEASFYVGQLQGSVRDEVVISELIGSDEYFNSIPFPEPAGFFVFAAASLMLMVRRRAGLAT